MGLTSDQRECVDGFWNDFTKPHGLSGVGDLYNSLKKTCGPITQSDIKDYLSEKRSYTLHKRTRKKFPRRRVLSAKPRVILACDLADMQHLAKENNGVKYLLLCVDVFSRFMIARTLSNKQGKTCSTALANILDSEDCVGVRKLWSDMGGEFRNKHVSEMLKARKITLYHTYSHEIKVSLAERAIQTIKNKIYRLLTLKGSYHYVTELPSLVKAYNSRVHGALVGKTPQEVHLMTSPEIIKQQFHRMHGTVAYKNSASSHKSDSLKVGDVVRTSIEKGVFDKGYNNVNTEELFKIRLVNRQQPVTTYLLEDLDGEAVEGQYYKEELVKTVLPQHFAIEIIDRRTRHKKKQVLVHYLGYSNKHDRWLDEEEIVSISDVT